LDFFVKFFFLIVKNIYLSYLSNLLQDFTAFHDEFLLRYFFLPNSKFLQEIHHFEIFP